MSDHLVRPVAFPTGVPQVIPSDSPDVPYDAYVEAWRFYGDICGTAYDGNRQLTTGPACGCPWCPPPRIAPCTCRYRVARVEARHIQTLMYNVLEVDGLAYASWFTIDEGCPHHGRAAEIVSVHALDIGGLGDYVFREYTRAEQNLAQWPAPMRRLFNDVLDEQERTDN